MYHSRSLDSCMSCTSAKFALKLLKEKRYGGSPRSSGVIRYALTCPSLAGASYGKQKRPYAKVPHEFFISLPS